MEGRREATVELWTKTGTRGAAGKTKDFNDEAGKQARDKTAWMNQRGEWIPVLSALPENKVTKYVIRYLQNKGMRYRYR